MEKDIDHPCLLHISLRFEVSFDLIYEWYCWVCIRGIRYKESLLKTLYKKNSLNTNWIGIWTLPRQIKLLKVSENLKGV